MIRSNRKISLIASCATVFLCVLITNLCQAQEQDPVLWKVITKKVDDRTYEVRLRAILRPPWHIYAQDVAEGVALPTTISFEKNPLLQLLGSIKEEGKLEEKTVDDIPLKYYSRQVDFIQQVKLKAAVKTSLKGNINFMICTHERCKPPADKGFTIILDGAN